MSLHQSLATLLNYPASSHLFTENLEYLWLLVAENPAHGGLIIGFIFLSHNNRSEGWQPRVEEETPRCQVPGSSYISTLLFLAQWFPTSW